MSENLTIQILSVSENGVELIGCSCIVILGSLIHKAKIPTHDFKLNITNKKDEDVLNILIKQQDGENIIKSFVTLGVIRRDQTLNCKLQPLGAKADSGSIFNLEANVSIGIGSDKKEDLKKSLENPFQYNLSKSENFSGVFGKSQELHQHNLGAKEIITEVPEVQSTQAIPDNQAELNKLIEELKISVVNLEKPAESTHEAEKAAINIEVKNLAISAPVYTTEDFVRSKENDSPEFGKREFNYSFPLTGIDQQNFLQVPGEHKGLELKNVRRNSRQFIDTARSNMEDVKIEKNEDYVLTMKNQLSSKHISFINDAFTREIILHMSQTKKKVSTVRLRRSITIRDKEEVEIDKKDYFNPNTTSKFVHFFQSNTKNLYLYNLVQPFDFVEESAKKIVLNIDFDISPLHQSVITPAGMIFIACANSEESNTLHVYNYKAQTLVDKPPMLCQSRKEYGFCYMSKNLFVIGGLVNGVISNKCERYDIRSNQWVKIAPMTRPIRESTVCGFNSRYLFRFFGIDSGNNIDHSIERYDAVRDTWTIMNITAPENIKEIYLPFATQIHPDHIFVFSGRNINGFSPKSCHGWLLKVEDKRGSNNAELIETKNFIPSLAGTFNANSVLTHAGDILFLRESY